MSENRNLTDRIITPFEKALDTLQEEQIITWEYCNSGKEPLTSTQLQSLTYQTFIGLYVHFEILNAPDQTARIAARIDETNTHTNKEMESAAHE